MFKMCTSGKSQRISLEICLQQSHEAQVKSFSVLTLKPQIRQSLCVGVVRLLVFKQPCPQNPTLWFWS